MPIEFDGRPGGANKRQRRRNSELPGPIKPPAPTLPPITMRIRILKHIGGSKHGTFKAGQVANLPVETARSWIGFGLAEEDKMIDSAPETK
jgi:hypothetical protein